jgi:hypothetical protein
MIINKNLLLHRPSKSTFLNNKHYADLALPEDQTTKGAVP